MLLEDIIFISQNLSALTGIPVRVFENDKIVQTFSTVELVKDPFILHMEKLEQETNLSYFSTDDFFFYAIEKSNEFKIVIGPFWPTRQKRQVYMDLAFKLEIEKDDITRFISSMTSITNMPLETVLQSLISYNYVLNKEKIKLGDLLMTPISNDTYNQLDYNDLEKIRTRNSTLHIEELLQGFIENGDLNGYLKWAEQAPAIHAGNMSNDFLRQRKNTFIVTATLLSRSAIKGGMEYTDAMNITDSYIFRCEASKSYNEISSLCDQLIREFISNVERIKDIESPLKSKISSYTYSHISEPINLEKIAEYLYMSKSNLCFKFKKETGTTIASFILEKKIDEGKRLILTTNKSLSSISLYLGFSSQAHFTKTFKDVTGITPNEFRNRNGLSSF